MQARRFLNYRL